MITPLGEATRPKAICLDIETGYSSADEIEARIRAWEPGNKTWKDETVERKRVEFALTARQESSLWDTAPILCVSCCTDEGLISFDGMGGGRKRSTKRKRAPKLEDGRIVRCKGEADLLVAVRLFLDAWHEPERGTLIVGHNVRGFDLPKLRMGYLRHRLTLPAMLEVVRDEAENGVRTVDIMTLFARYFSLENRPESGKRPFVSFATVMRYLDLDPYPEGFEGDQCPEWHEQGRHDLVLAKAMLDCREEFRAYEILSGKAPDLG